MLTQNNFNFFRKLVALCFYYKFEMSFKTIKNTNLFNFEVDWDKLQDKICFIRQLRNIMITIAAIAIIGSKYNDS